MGCLFELIELIVEILVDGFFELIVHGYLKLMSLIVPNKTISDDTKYRLEIVVKTFSAIVGITLIIGLLLVMQSDPIIKNIGRYLTYIPLAIIGIQIVLGILFKIVSKKR